MTDVIFPHPDDPPDLKKRIYKGWLKMSDAILGARDLKAQARKALAQLEQDKGESGSPSRTKQG